MANPTKPYQDSGHSQNGNLTVDPHGLSDASKARTVLRLPDARRRLPTLSNHCFIVGEAKRADVIWSEADFLALCNYMLNENPTDHFLTAWIDKATGQARFAKAPVRCRADKRASWAWATITGKAKAKTAIGFYPSNPEKKSRWAAIDFDAHNGEHEQARKRSLEAFSLLLQQPQLHLILCASGNGYHLFICTLELYPVGEWIVLLKQVCEWIGAPIADGVCEIFPNERAESQRTGKGIRAPGTWNPKSDTFSLIEAETVRPLLETLPKPSISCVGKVNRALLRNNKALSLQRSTSTYSLSTEPLIEDVIRRHPITRKGTRNSVLMKLIGDLAHKFGREKSREIVERHYQTYEANTATPLEEHMRQFEIAWAGEIGKIRDRFAFSEKAIYDQLRTDHQREAFRIAWAFAGVARYKSEHDFLIARNSLADRLSITPAGGSYVIQVLIDNGAIRSTEPYQRHVCSAQFMWICGEQRPSSLNSRAAQRLAPAIG